MDLDINLKDFLADESKEYDELKVNSYDIIKLSNKSRYTNDIVRNAMNNKIIPFPRFDSFNLHSNDDWNTVNDKYGKSYQLYIHTLRFVNELLLQYVDTKEKKYLDKAERFIEKWIVYASKPKVSKMVWYDHSAAQRTQVLLYFVYLSQNTKGFDKNKYGRLLEFHGIFLAKDAVYHRTNHGLMMDRSIMTLGIVLGNEPLFNYGYFRSIDTFWYSFSSKGLHLENSPGYHNMVVKMYRQIESFLHKNDKSYGEVVNSTLDKADEIKGLITLPQEIMPNIGDTGNKVAQNKTSYENFVDYEGGLTIIQDELKMLHATFISGYSSITHKHFDDLSFALMYKGLKFLEEAGRYNYSRHAYRKYVKSPQAHSGMYIVGEDYSLKKDNRFSRKVRIDYHIENENFFQVKGSHEDYEKADLSRQVIYLKKESIFIIFDKVVSNGSVEIIHNYNLNKDVEVKNIQNDSYLLSNNGVNILLESHSEVDSSEIINGSLNIDNVIALNSPEYNEIEVTSQIKFHNKLEKNQEKTNVFTLSEKNENRTTTIKYDSVKHLLKINVNEEIYYINL